MMKQAFKEYYFKSADKIEVPSRIGEREFGYLPFGGTMVRHLPFKSSGELIALLVKEAPASAYCSSGYYLEPARPMHEKGWKGADIVFDIDGDQLNSKCRAEHDAWRCSNCLADGKGLRPEKCPKCGGIKLQEDKWACDLCLGRAAKEVVKLMDFLIRDFGVKKSEIKQYFSGNLGYHISVENRALETLDQAGRNEIADYLRGVGLVPETLGVSKHGLSKLPSPGEPGWRGRVAEYLVGLENAVGSDGKASKLYSRSHGSFKKLLEQAVTTVMVGIDVQVTTDIHRIFRMPGTLHGSTGLVKRKFDDVLSFDPLREAIVLSGEATKIFVNRAPKFELFDRWYGPYHNEEVRLPLYAAVYLIAKKTAKAV